MSNKHPECPQGIHDENMAKHGWCASCSQLFDKKPVPPSPDPLREQLKARLTGNLIGFKAMATDDTDLADFVDKVMLPGITEAITTAVEAAKPPQRNNSRYPEEDGYNQGVSDYAAALRRVLGKDSES